MEEPEAVVEEVVEEDILDYLKEVSLRQMPSSWVVELWILLISVK